MLWVYNGRRTRRIGVEEGKSAFLSDATGTVKAIPAQTETRVGGTSEKRGLHWSIFPARIIRTISFPSPRLSSLPPRSLFPPDPDGGRGEMTRLRLWPQ